MPEDRISVLQFNAMLLIFLTGNFDLFEPRAVATAAGSDALLSVALGTLLALLIVGALLYLGLRFPQVDVMNYSVSLLGRPLGQAAGAVYLFVLVFGAARPATATGLIGWAAFGWPMPAALAAVFLAVVVGALLAGRNLKLIALISEYAAPVGIAVVLITGLTVLGKVNWANFTPLTMGWRPVVQGTLDILSEFSLAYVILFFLPRTKDAANTTGITLATVVLVGLLMCAGTLAVGLHGVGAVAASTIPSLQLLSDSLFGRTIALFDLAVLLWMLGLVIKVAVAYWLLARVLAETAGTPARRFIVPVGTAVLLIAVFLLSNLGQHYVFVGYYFRYFSYAAGIAIPLLLLLIAALRRIEPRKDISEA